MDLFELTRALIDIESISGKEKQVGLFLFGCLSKLAARHQGRVERMEVEPNRFNLFAQWGEPIVTLSSHMDTVPPFIPFREDAERSEEHTSELQSPCNLVCRLLLEKKKKKKKMIIKSK